MMTLKKIQITILFLVLVPLIFIRCSNVDQTNNENLIVKIAVTTVNPSMQSITNYIKFNGSTMFQKKDNIRSINTGYIKSLNFKVGDLIQSGQQFCQIVTKEQAALKSFKNLDSSLIKFQLPVPIYSNAKGVIATIGVMQGDFVNEGDVIATISEPSSLVVLVNVPFEYHKLVSIGAACTILFSDGSIVPAKISGTFPTIETSSQAQTYFIRLPEIAVPESLNVVVKMPLLSKDKVKCVPNGALQTDEMQKSFWVMKIIGDTMAVKEAVQLGLQNDTYTEILSGNITANDKLVLDGAFGMSDSSLIRIEDK